MPPKSVVLVASLQPAEKSAAAPATKADTEQRLQRTQVIYYIKCRTCFSVFFYTQYCNDTQSTDPVKVVSS